MPKTCRVAIITALKEELAAVEAAIPAGERSLVTLLRGGVGWQSAQRAADKLLGSAERPALICSTGFCGGLVDALEVGHILLPDVLRAQDVAADYRVTAPPGPAALRAALSDNGVSAHGGALVTARAAVTACADKRALGLTRDAAAVDMESFALAERAEAAGVPILALRAVSDSVFDELPAEVGGFLDEKGGVRMGKVARFALKSPRNVKTLMELKARTEKAAAGLTAAWKAIWPRLREEYLK